MNIGKESLEGRGGEERLKPVVPTLVVVGRIGAGKGTMAEIVQSRFGFSHHTASDVLKQELFLQGLHAPYTRDQLSTVSHKLREQDKATVAKRLLQTIADEHSTAPKKGAIIEGFRYADLAEYVVQFPNVALCWVEANQQTRFNNVKKRNRAGDVLSWDEFLSKDIQEAESLNEVEALARKKGVVLLNEGTKEEFSETVERFITKTFPGAIKA